MLARKTVSLALVCLLLVQYGDHAWGRGFGGSKGGGSAGASRSGGGGGASRAGSGGSRNAYDNGATSRSSRNAYDNGETSRSSRNAYDNGETSRSSRNAYDNGETSRSSRNAYDNGETSRSSRNAYDNGETSRSSRNAYDNGATPTASGLNSFLGLPSDGGMHGLSTTRSDGDVTAERTVAEGPRGGVAAGEEVEGPDGRTAERGAAVGPDGGVAAGRGVEGADGATAGEAAVARGNGVAAGFRYTAPSSRYTAAAGARGAFDDHGIYGAGWYGAHPGAWAPTGWAAGAAWTPATWGACGSWLGYGATAPTYYDYGNNVVIQDNSVTVNGQDAGTPQEYYQQANDLATQGADAPASDDDQWMPLGVFSLVHHENATSKLTVQLAVNKQGVLRGNYTDAAKDQTQPIHGQVDKSTQRAAWTVGDNTKTVLETGLYNLTKDEAPCLIHSGADHTDQWLLVRLKQDATADAGQDGGAAGGDAGQDGTGAAGDPNADPAGEDGNPAANTDN